MSTDTYKHSVFPHIYRHVEPEVLRDTIVKTIPRVAEISGRATVCDVMFTADNGLQLTIKEAVHPYEKRLRDNMVWITNEMMIHIAENEAYMDLHGTKHNGSMRKRTFDYAECQSCISACKNIDASDIVQLIVRVSNIRIIEIKDYGSQYAMQ